MIRLPDKSTVLLPFRQPTSNRNERLAVGVVIGSSGPQPWVEALISFLRQLPGIELRVMSVTGRTPAATSPPAWMTDRLYSASRVRFDPFGDIAARDEPKTGGLESVEEICVARCGVLIWMADGKDPGVDLRSISKHGVFTVRLGKHESLIPLWHEVAAGEVTSAMAIYWHESSFLRGRAVRIAETSTVQGLHFTANAEGPIAACIRALAGLCLEMRDEGPRFAEKLRSFPEESMESVPSAGYPTGLEVGRFVFSKLARSAGLRWKTRGKAVKWFVAMRPNSGASVTDSDRLDLTGFRDVPYPSGTAAMADPFLSERDDRSYLLFEDVPSGSARGRIGCVEILEDGSCSEMNIVLERPHHLSYPCVTSFNGELFLLPESAESGRVELYRFTRFPNETELVARLVEQAALVDTTPVFLNGRWYFFTTTPHPFMETLLCWSDRLDGPWHLHPCSPISCSVRNSRSAGNLFWRNGCLYRPTQDCSVRYGYAIRVNRVLRMTPTEFEEEKVNWIPPSWSSGLLGTHTWNESSKLQVIDGIRLEPR